MKRTLLFFLLSISMLPASRSLAQEAGTGVPPMRRVPTLVDTVTIMPYLTGSFNFFSGQAFPASANGAGFGGGLAFDLTNQGQKTGLMFDFAFQNMHGVAQNGSCINISGDTILASADAYHYWYYLLFEPFLKIQTGAKQKGYFIIGASFGLSVLSETVSIGQGQTVYTLWNTVPNGNRFRLDLRLGVGAELGKIAGHDLVLEARAGYPITDEISNYANVCSGTGPGNWKIITLQGNLGIRI